MNNCKKLAIFVVFAFIGINLNAQENGFTFTPHFGGGGFSTIFTFDRSGKYVAGTQGEFAFLFFENNFQISYSIIGKGSSISTGYGDNYGTGSITNKISLGGYLPKDFLRSYSFIEGGIGFGAGTGTNALSYIFGGGGGIDLFFNETGTIYTEFGYLQHYIHHELVGGIAVSLGVRRYFRR
jgi:hypothetical protein